MPKLNTQPNPEPVKPADDDKTVTTTNTDGAQDPPEDKGAARQKNLITLLAALKTYGPAVTINADLSHNSVQRRLQNAINGMDSDRWVHYVRDVFADHFIYEARGHDPATGIYMCHLYMRDYTVNEMGTIVTLGDTVTEVIEETTFIPVPAMAANHRKETPPMNKEKIDALIANEATNFVECDRAWLGTLKDDQLDKLVPKDPPKPDPAANAKPETKPEPPKTAEEYVAAAPEEYRPLLANALETVKAEKKALVDALLANANNKFTQPQLDAKDVQELRNLVELGKVEVNFAGKSGGPAAPPVANGPGDMLDAPKREVKQPATAAA